MLLIKVAIIKRRNVMKVIVVRRLSLYLAVKNYSMHDIFLCR